MHHTLDSAGRALVVEFPGDVLSTNIDTLRTGVLELVDRDADRWDVFEADLRHARMVDSMGLNMIVGLHKQLHARSKRLRIRTASAHLSRALRFTRMDQLAEVVEE